ncbi:MAG: hypothetical protein F4Z33_08750, partial [Gemmatimonadales bacterium]|nr:hypothetical protein [Gemmatimonadales bacterium]
MAGRVVSITAKVAGTALITVIATDPDGLSAQQNFEVTVPNRAPVAAGSLPAKTLVVGQTVAVDVSPYFHDPDGDTLTYTASSSDTGVATVSISGSTVAIAAVAKGATQVTVAAADPEGLAATQAFQSVVPNRAPEPVGTITDQTVDVGETVTVDLAPYFHDPDGDGLTYTASSSDTGVATVSISGSTVTIAAVARGATQVTVAAADPEGLAATQTFQSVVHNRAPEPVGTITDQTVDVGETVTVDLAPYFHDPDGDALTYGATSSNPSVATASVSGSIATITAVAAGSATITVTARDQGGLTATQRVDIIVRLVNRAPRAVGTIPAATLASGGTATVDASLYFTDPDGDALTYSATSSNPSVTRASISGSIVTITAVAAGSATITVTARDQGGLAATEQVHVTVTDGVGLRDDFNSSASLADWRLLRATAVVNNGVLALTKTTDYTGVAARDLAESITSWTLAIRMGRGQPADSAVAVAWRTGHTKYTWAGFYIMPHEENNYFLLVYDSASGYWDTITNSSGNSDAISVEAGELTTISVSFIDGQFQG